MICPSKICKNEIPEDSLYCDQCGIKLLRCQKCNSVGISKFCGKCGGCMIFSNNQFNQITDSIPEVTETKNTNVFSKPQEQFVGTQIIQLDSSIPSLELCHNDGWTIEPKAGNVLGRTTGEFVSKLGCFPVISSRHAQVSFNDGKWFITDLHSTNKTYINNNCLVPDNPTEIKNNDVLILANVPFVVRTN